MTREEAVSEIENTPAFIPGPCSRCGAVTLDEASGKCRPYSLPSGEYACGTPEEAPDTGGLLHQVNPRYAQLDGYLWHWYAFDEGMTSEEPKWSDPDS